jgi:hypothetical protein
MGSASGVQSISAAAIDAFNCLIHATLKRSWTFYVLTSERIVRAGHSDEGKNAGMHTLRPHNP